MADEPRKDIDEWTVPEQRTPSDSDAEERPDGAGDESVDEDVERAPDGEKPASEITAPSIGPNTVIEKEPAEERLAKHEQSDVDAMGLDKRRPVVGERYGASFAKQATVYGVFLVVLVAVLVGGKLAVDELDKGPAQAEDKAPWAQEDATQRPPEPLDFPRNPSP
jgi:hypothetical protein